MSPGHEPPTLEAVHVWWCNARAAGPSLVDVLSAAERVRHDRIAPPDDRARYLTARVLVRATLGEYLGCRPAEVDLVVRCAVCGGPHGKPALSDGSLQFSLTHAAELVGVAVARAPVGLDCESVDTGHDPAVAAESLAEEEFAAWSSLPPPARPFAFLRYWTRKEAVLKAWGVGLSGPLQEVVVSAAAEPARLVRGPGQMPIVLFDLAARPGYVGALATVGASLPVVWERDGTALIADC